jgi:hypothetical protein
VNQAAPANNGNTHYMWNVLGNIIAKANCTTGAALRYYIYLEGIPVWVINVALSLRQFYGVHVDHLKEPLKSSIKLFCKGFSEAETPCLKRQSHLASVRTW